MANSDNISSSILARFSELELESPFAIVVSAIQGINPTLFYDFADAIKMPRKNLAQLLNLSLRNISNHAASQKTLEPGPGEHLLKLIALFRKGEQSFGNVDKFNYWLQKPSWNSIEKPIDWMVTTDGVGMVMDELDRLGHGYIV